MSLEDRGLRAKASRIRSVLKRRAGAVCSMEQLAAWLLGEAQDKVKLVWRCKYCRDFLKLNQITVDHLMPVSLGGSNRLDNLGVACRKCNERKGPISAEFFERLLAEIELWPS